MLIVRQLPYWVRHLFRSLQRLQFVCTFFILVYCGCRIGKVVLSPG